MSRDGVIPTRSFADLRSEPVEWLVQDRVPLGALTVLAGHPGLGKSTLTAEWAARASRATSEPASVILVGSEDSPTQTIRPRLQAAGARLDRVRFMTARDLGDSPLHVTLPDDVAALAHVVGEHGARLVVVDPLAAHLSASIDAHKDQRVRHALAPLAGLAAHAGCAVVVVAHLNKGQVGQAIQRVGGSVGIVAAARSVLFLLPDPEDPTDGRVLAHAKCNLSRPAPTLRLRLETVSTGVVRIREVGECAVTAEELVNEASSGRSALGEAMAFLRAELADGPVRVTEVSKRAEQVGIAEKTLQRARAALRVERTKRGFGPNGYWVMSLDDGPDPKSVTRLSQPDGDGRLRATPARDVDSEGEVADGDQWRSSQGDRLSAPCDEDSEADREIARVLDRWPDMAPDLFGGSA